MSDSQNNDSSHSNYGTLPQTKHDQASENDQDKGTGRKVSRKASITRTGAVIREENDHSLT